MGFDREDWEELKSDVSNTIFAILIIVLVPLLGCLILAFFFAP